jgi:hypothetical protein
MEIELIKPYIIYCEEKKHQKYRDLKTVDMQT